MEVERGIPKRRQVNTLRTISGMVLGHWPRGSPKARVAEEKEVDLGMGGGLRSWGMWAAVVTGGALTRTWQGLVREKQQERTTSAVVLGRADGRAG